MSEENNKSYIAPSRQGKTLVGAHLDPETKMQLKVIAAKENTSIQSLLEEAINNLIKSRQD